ncbi:hypothetical protein ACQUEF_13200 [Vagococcus fluvialis]|uniref:hypothetical protein n=1 Tax=Vagococcus fluvialis TaxID=2738 RepID=UPI00288E63FC|nr:hypothetical protein [Vagococcus fluvialis]MDT2782642.1 hypothetical protein [Vagococcus fluvialis]
MALTKRTKKERPTVENVAPTSLEETARSMSQQEEINEKTEKAHRPRRTPVTPASTENDKINFDRADEFNAKDRKTTKIDPDIKSIIEIITEFSGGKEYSTIRDIVQFYFENNLDERTQRIVAIMQNNKFIK